MANTDSLATLNAESQATTTEDTFAALKAKALQAAPAALLALGILVHLLSLLSLRFGWLNPLFNDTIHRIEPAGDFFSLYAAGVKARAGEAVYTMASTSKKSPTPFATPISSPNAEGRW